MKKILIGLSFFLFFICTTAFSKVSKDVINSKAIYLDAGHGGMDGGTSYNGILEKDVDLDFVFTLKEVLENNGYIVYLTREGDYDLASANSKNRKREDIQKRVDLINSSNCFLYLSIHFPGHCIVCRGAPARKKPSARYSDLLKAPPRAREPRGQLRPPPSRRIPQALLSRQRAARISAFSNAGLSVS